jgi:hypothetical protein
MVVIEPSSIVVIEPSSLGAVVAAYIAILGPAFLAMTAPDWDAVYSTYQTPIQDSVLMRALDDELGSIFIPVFTFLGRKPSVYNFYHFISEIA